MVGGAGDGSGADDFLGTQGDPWDTQSDMFCALLGALTTVLVLAGWHNRQLKLPDSADAYPAICPTHCET